ncbi:hypothetical protein B0H19DRAFT_1105470 [Mycena capillaripes]|nr:hypothetical protein B0H19DRAFT_1105470 [Mycena capillaripes]
MKRERSQAFVCPADSGPSRHSGEKPNRKRTGARTRPNPCTRATWGPRPQPKISRKGRMGRKNRGFTGGR